jgi:hypothetical protein
VVVSQGKVKAGPDFYELHRVAFDWSTFCNTPNDLTPPNAELMMPYAIIRMAHHSDAKIENIKRAAAAVEALNEHGDDWETILRQEVRDTTTARNRRLEEWWTVRLAEKREKIRLAVAAMRGTGDITRGNKLDLMGRCSRCGSAYHDHNLCVADRESPPVMTVYIPNHTCKKCNQMGHWSSDCQSCDLCGQWGHTNLICAWDVTYAEDKNDRDPGEVGRYETYLNLRAGRTVRAPKERKRQTKDKIKWETWQPTQSPLQPREVEAKARPQASSSSSGTLGAAQGGWGDWNRQSQVTPQERARPLSRAVSTERDRAHKESRAATYAGSTLTAQRISEGRRAEGWYPHTDVPSSVRTVHLGPHSDARLRGPEAATLTQWQYDADGAVVVIPAATGDWRNP